MASRLLVPRVQSASRLVQSTSRFSPRYFQTSSRLLQDGAPVKRPVGAFRGGIFGFLLGTSLAGASVYYYILEEYRVSNQLLTEDIYSLQSAIQRTHTHINELEDKLAQQGGSKK